jgi:hypothetical protein
VATHRDAVEQHPQAPVEIVLDRRLHGDLRERLDVRVLLARDGADACRGILGVGGPATRQRAGQLGLRRPDDEPQHRVERVEPVLVRQARPTEGAGPLRLTPPSSRTSCAQ